MKSFNKILAGVLVGALIGVLPAYALISSSFSALQGSASSPVFTFVDDGDSGFYQDATGQVQVTLDGVASYTFDSGQLILAQNVSIEAAATGDSAATPAYSWDGDEDLGLFRNDANDLGVAATDLIFDPGENKRILVDASTGVGHTLALIGGGGAAANAGGPISVTGGAPASGNGAGGAASLVGGAGSGTGAGGAVTVTGGASGGGATGAGGAITATGGAASSTNDAGGAVSYTGGAGAGTGAGGAASLVGGAGGGSNDNAADGGAVTITGGASTATGADADGGDVTITGGSAASGTGGTEDGGNVVIAGGAGGDGGVEQGNVLINANLASAASYLVINGGAAEVAAMPVAADLEDPGAVAGAGVAIVVGDDGSDPCIIFVSNDAGTINAVSLILDGAVVTWDAGQTTPLDCEPDS